MKNLLIIGYNWPEPATTAAGGRMMQLIRCFEKAGYRQTFASTASRTSYTTDLEAEGIHTRKIQLNDPSFDHFLAELQPDVVLFDRFYTEEQFGWRVQNFAPGALRILDTEDLHSLRFTREEACREGKPFSKDRWLQQDLTLRELASIWRSDLTLIISSFEYSLLLKEAKIVPSMLLLIPFMTENTENKNHKDFDSRKDFICIGNGKHRPNVDAVHYLYQKIWPELKKSLPQASLRVYGAYLPEALLQLHRPARGFYVEGWVEDAAAAMGEARVQLAPLQYGAGIKGKLLLSMQEGTPSVTTRIGAEGMHNELPWNGIIADEPSEFINAAVKLYTDEALWSKSVDAGKTLLHAIYDQELLCQRLLDAVETNCRSMEQQRAKNLFGNILRHQSMGATMYMSKWIEAKNKNQEREQE